MMNIENGVRKPSKLAVKVMRYLHSLPEKEANNLIEKLNEYHPK